MRRYLNRPLLAGLVLAGLAVLLYLWLGATAPAVESLPR